MNRLTLSMLASGTIWLKAAIAVPVIFIGLLIVAEPVVFILLVCAAAAFVYSSIRAGYPWLPVIYYLIVAVGIAGFVLADALGPESIESADLAIGLAASAFWPLILSMEIVFNGGPAAETALVYLAALPISVMVAALT